MNPQDLKIQELEKQLNDLKSLVENMRRPNTVDAEFQQVLNRNTLATSAKGATSENQTVNEGGVASYAVLGIPTGYLQVTIDATAYYIPYFSA